MARIRIRDIAQEAGVSQATVSRYLNGHFEAMSAATRERVAEVIERTGYRPSSVARSLRLERSGTIGLVLADMQNPYSGAMLAALDARAAARGLSLMTAVSENDPAREAQAIERLANTQVDGLIVNTCGGNDELIARTARTLPTVLLDRPVLGGAVDVVTSNNAALVRGLLDEVARGGANACLMVTERDDASPIRRERAHLFTAELARRGMAGTVVSLPAERRATRETLRARIDALAAETVGGSSEAHGGVPKASPVGVIAVNGLVLLDVVEALGGLSDGTAAERPAGARATAAAADAAAAPTRAAAASSAAPTPAPPRVLLATFDDYAWNRVLFGGITTAVQDTAAIADAVLARLAARIAETDRAEGAPVRIEVPGAIARRATTAPRPS